MEQTHMSEAIKRAYDAPGAPESYGRNTTLLKAESFILSYLGDELKDKAILDIGVGAGRTVPYLSSLSKDYTGVDYSNSMLQHCAAKYRDTKLLLCDARNMDIFGAGVFDVVFCCWNMLDDANHEDRCRTLKEIYRVLRHQGLFIFSAHNLDFKRRSAYKFRGFVSAQGPVELIKQNAVRIIRYFKGILNHLHYQRQEEHARDYSIINDPSHSYSLLTYYIKKENQVRQLEQMGFSGIQMVDEHGSLITLDEDCRDGWIYYICRKIPGER
jgi:ubiquinone/menaquinone biosynthesis C-methylase UbiE